MKYNLWVKKPLSLLMSESEGEKGGLKRSLGASSVVMIGVGAIIGAGLFVRTAAAAAEHAGPAVTISFIIAAIGCAFAGLCYAEFASMIPVAGSAYTYSYATLGELTAWIIGWDLILEYALGAATVAIAWSQYMNNMLGWFGWQVPYEWCHSPFEHSMTGVSGIMNIPAVIILFLLTAILIRGISQSAIVNNIIVIVKVSIVLVFIALGWSFITPEHLTPFIPGPETFTDPGTGIVKDFEGGWMGIIAGAGVVFFAFIGFDAVSTTAQESKNPKRDMPIGILGSLAICTALYVLFSYVLTGIADFREFRVAGKEASVTFAISHYMHNEWLARAVTIAILFGFSSVILVMLLGQSRVFFTMSRDGLIPPIFSELHPKYHTPYKSNRIFFIMVGLFAAFVPESIVGDMTSIGTLFAFLLVSIGVIIIRKKNPDLPRGFKTPLVPLIPILGVLVCGLMIFGLGWENWSRLLVWLLIGFVIYFGYSVKKSKMQHYKKEK